MLTESILILIWLSSVLDIMCHVITERLQTCVICGSGVVLLLCICRRTRYRYIRVEHHDCMAANVVAGSRDQEGVEVESQPVAKRLRSRSFPLLAPLVLLLCLALVSTRLHRQPRSMSTYRYTYRLKH